MLIEKRNDFIKALKSRGVPASVVHLRIDNNSIFNGITPGLKNQEKFNTQQVSVPIHSSLTDDDINLIISSIKKGW